MEVTELGMAMLVRPERQKALSPIVVTEPGIVRLLIAFRLLILSLLSLLTSLTL